MAIANVEHDGSWFRVFDERGKEIAKMSAPRGAEVKGNAGDFFVVDDGNWIRTYSADAKEIAKMSKNKHQVVGAGGSSFTTKDGSFTRTFDRSCKQTGQR